MLSNIFSRLLPSIRSVQPYPRYCLRFLSTMEGNQREKGVVKRFSKERGYGFISKNSDGSDCFVYFRNINTDGFKTLEAGQEVEFAIVQGEKGVEARDVNILGEAPATETSRAGFGARPPRTRSSKFDFGGLKSTFFSNDDDPSAREKSFDNQFRSSATGQRETGSVKRWTAERGFGFIRRNNGGSDLFCHARSLKDGVSELQEGQQVQFRIQSTEKGEEARDVTLLTDDSVESEPSSATGTRQKGTVKRWLTEKGFGFVRTESSDTDIFVHARDLNDGVTSLEEGQTVEFDLVRNNKGETGRNVTVDSSN